MSLFNNFYFVNIEGLNLGNVLHNIKKKNIKIFFAKKISKHNLVIKILIKNYALVKQIANDNLNITSIISEDGIIKKTGFFIARLGVVLGLIFSLCFVYIASGMLNRVSVTVNGNSVLESTQFSETIYNYLTDKGVYSGASISQIDTNVIKQNLRCNFSEIADLSVVKKGVVLFVDIELAQKTLITDTSALVAKNNAVVTKIEKMSGKLCVNEGDTVVEGQLLIDALNIKGENVGANGKVYARVWYSSNKVSSTSFDRFERSGNCYCITEYFIGSKKIAGDSLDSNKFELYETEQTTTYVCDNLFLPIKVVKTWFYERIKTQVTLSYDDLVSLLKDECYFDAISKVPAGLQFENITYSISNEGENLRVDCFIEVVENIAIVKNL